MMSPGAYHLAVQWIVTLQACPLYGQTNKQTEIIWTNKLTHIHTVRQTDRQLLERKQCWL
jgi:hypothetical protein